MPRLNELEGCIAADRTGIRKRIEAVKAVKYSTQKIVYESVLRVRKHIDAHYSDPTTLTILSKVGHTSQFKLNREFKQTFQVTPGQYLTERRLAAARILLKKENLSVLEIALRVGWESITSFNKAFKKAHGMSPLQFKKSNLG